MKAILQKEFDKLHLQGKGQTAQTDGAGQTIHNPEISTGIPDSGIRVRKNGIR
jgi:hypothetical protein